MRKIMRRFYKHGTCFEDFELIYEQTKGAHHILVRNMNTNKYSFGVESDFKSLYGFPVNQSCLTLDEAKQRLKSFIKIDKQYNLPAAYSTLDIYEGMLKALESVTA